MRTRTVTIAAIVERLSAADRLVEVGIGTRTDVAAALAAERPSPGGDADTGVVATDIRSRSVPDGVRFVRDDVTDPTPGVYAGADAVYALNLPPELHRPTRRVAREAGADFLFTTLGGDPPAIPATPETVPGETLYVADDSPGPGSRR